MGELVSQMSCCLCDYPHTGKTLTPGWYAEGISAKGCRAKRILCPKCLEKLGVKVTKGYAVEPSRRKE